MICNFLKTDVALCERFDRSPYKYHGYTITLSNRPSGSTALTRSFYVLSPAGDGMIIKKRFRYQVGDYNSKFAAKEKAFAWIDDQVAPLAEIIPS